MRALAWIGAVAFAAGTAQAGIFHETESNNTRATANVIGSVNAPGDSFLIDGSITPGGVNTPGDVDWFAFDFNGVTTFVAAAYALPASTELTDGQMMLVDSAGTIIAFDDDSNLGFMPSIEAANLPAGRYYLGLSGFNDANVGAGQNPLIFDGLTGTGPNGHTENWSYKIIAGANVVPAPASTAIFGIAGFALLRRRR